MASPPGDQVRRTERAGDRGQDADGVADADRIVRPQEPLEGAPRAFRNEGGGAGVLAIGVIAAEIVQGHVVGVDMPAGLDVGGGKADDLAVFDDGSPCRDPAHGRLVTGRDVLAQDRLLLRKLLPAGERPQRHHHTVVGVQPDAGSVRVRHEAFPFKLRCGPRARADPRFHGGSAGGTPGRLGAHAGCAPACTAAPWRDRP